jgi:hypothetical protein
MCRRSPAGGDAHQGGEKLDPSFSPVGWADIAWPLDDAAGRGKVEWGLLHRGRISPEEAAWVREHLDEVQRLRSERGAPLLDPADPKTKERYGL